MAEFLKVPLSHLVRAMLRSLPSMLLTHLVQIPTVPPCTPPLSHATIKGERERVPKRSLPLG
jgi:hypothetical protein